MSDGHAMFRGELCGMLARLFDDARAVLEELRDEPVDLHNPADACALGALYTLQYLSALHGDDRTGEDAFKETASVLHALAGIAHDQAGDDDAVPPPA